MVKDVWREVGERVRGSEPVTEENLRCATNGALMRTMVLLSRWSHCISGTSGNKKAT